VTDQTKVFGLKAESGRWIFVVLGHYLQGYIAQAATRASSGVHPTATT
jgi:hypothetical protein